MEVSQFDVDKVREEVERVLERYGEETTRTPLEQAAESAEGTNVSVTTMGVRGRPRLLFCGVVAGPFAHGLLLPHESLPSPLDIYAVCVVPTQSLLTIEAIDINIKEWTLSDKQASYSIRVDEVAKFCNLVLNANALAIEALYAESYCWQSDEWRDLKQRYRDRLITDNTITKLLGPAKVGSSLPEVMTIQDHSNCQDITLTNAICCQDYLTKKEKKRKRQEKQRRKKEDDERKQRTKAPKVKGRSEERQQELALVEEKMRTRAEERRKKAEERKERQLAKQAADGAAATPAGQTNANPLNEEAGAPAPKGDEMYNHIRLLFQAKRILAGQDPVLNLLDVQEGEEDRGAAVREEGELLLRVRQGCLDETEEDRLIVDMVGEIERAVDTKERTMWKDGVERSYNVPKTLLDPWIVELRRKERFFWVTTGGTS